MENIMDKITKTAVNTYCAASKQASKITKEMKLKTKMVQNKNKIQELYEDIGKKVYEKYLLKEDIKIESDLFTNCSAINTLAEENEDLRMEILKLKKLKQCPECHYEIYYEFKYCPNCGHEQKHKENTGNNTSATLVTTDEEDKTLRQHMDAYPTDDEE